MNKLEYIPGDIVKIEYGEATGKIGFVTITFLRRKGCYSLVVFIGKGFKVLLKTIGFKLIMMRYLRFLSLLRFQRRMDGNLVMDSTGLQMKKVQKQAYQAKLVMFGMLI